MTTYYREPPHMAKVCGFRRYCQFSVRSLLVLTLVIAAFLAGLTAERRRAEKAIDANIRVRLWLAKNAYAPVILHGVGPSIDWDEWIAEGRTIPYVEPELRMLLIRRDSSVDLRLVAQSLARLGNSETVPALIDCLEGEDLHLRMQAACALGALRDERAVKPLGKLLTVEDDVNVRANIVSALADIGGHDAIEYLEVATRDESEFVAEIAKEALRK